MERGGEKTKIVPLPPLVGEKERLSTFLLT